MLPEGTLKVAGASSIALWLQIFGCQCPYKYWRFSALFQSSRRWASWDHLDRWSWSGFWESSWSFLCHETESIRSSSECWGRVLKLRYYVDGGGGWSGCLKFCWGSEKYFFLWGIKNSNIEIFFKGLGGGRYSNFGQPLKKFLKDICNVFIFNKKKGGFMPENYVT